MAPYLDPQNQAFIDAGAKAGGPPIYKLSNTDARALLEGINKHEPASDISVEEFDAPVGPSGSVKTIIFRPKDVTGDLPVLFYTHGGGWILGSPNTHGPLCEDLARQAGCAVVFPYYTPAPEKQYPTQFEESYGVLEYIVKNGAKHGLKTNKIVFAGDSVGGHMAIAMTYFSIKNSLIIPSQLVLFYPVTTTRVKLDTFTEFKNGPYLAEATLDWMYDAFLPNASDRFLPVVSPLEDMPDEDLKKFPPTLVLPSGVDPLRAEGEAFGHRLQGLGVETAVLRADGQVHDYAMLLPTRISPTARAVVQLAALKVKIALS